MSNSFSDNSGMIWSGGGLVFRREAMEEEREGKLSLFVVTEMVFFRVRVREERCSEAREKTTR